MPGLLDGSPRLTKLYLPGALRAELFARALATPEVEVCGMLGGRGERALTHYPLDNVDPLPALRFFVDPRGQLRAMQAMRGRDEALVGIYHSHPASPALPSAHDREFAAYPGVAYLIVSLADPAGPVLGSFVFDGEDFAPLAVEGE